jgi:hypothetical protein
MCGLWYEAHASTINLGGGRNAFKLTHCVNSNFKVRKVSQDEEACSVVNST